MAMTVVGTIRSRAESFCELPAIIEYGRAWSHGELWDRVDRLSCALAALGLKPGEVLMAWLPNCREMIEAELAALQSGFVWVAVNARFTAGEAAEIMRDCEPRAIIADGAHADAVNEAIALWAPAGGAPAVILTGEPYESLIAGATPRRPDVRIGREAIARLRYTSGTTGKAKAAILPHRVYEASLRNLQHELHTLAPDDRVLHAAPLTHASGALVFPILAAGGANIIAGHMTPEAMLAAIERERVTTMFVVPTILQRLVESPAFGKHDLSSLRTIMYGGAPTPPGKLDPAVRALGPVLVHIFGMTEAPYPITVLRREEHWSGNPKLGSIGRPSTICEVQARGEDGVELPAGKVGEIWIKGENVMQGYWHDEAETLRVLCDGWLASGDLGGRDDDGYYWIVDRKKDVIITGGFNVYATEVEAALCAHPGVAEAAVVGAPDSDWGESVVAYVVMRADSRADESGLREWCRDRLAGYKQPRGYRFVAELPHNAAGKMSKPPLRELERKRGAAR